MAKKYHHGDLRQAMVDAALDFLEQNDARDLSIRALAKRIGVSEAAPYHHFSDRRGLELAVVARGYDILHADMLAVTARKDARLTDLLRAYVGFAMAHPNLFRLMHRSGEARDPANEQVFARSNAAFAPLLDMVRSRLAARGFTEADIGFAALMAWTQVHGLAEVVVSDFLRLGDTRDAFCERAYAFIDASLEALTLPAAGPETAHRTSRHAAVPIVTNS